MNLTGTDNDETLTGTPGADSLDGAGGNDRVDGLGGNDTLFGGAGDDRVSGGDGQDSLNGGSGNDILDGGAGADAMSGGDGYDWYYVDDAGDVVTEAAGQGWDRVYASASYTLTAGAEIEEIHTSDASGTQTLHLTGNVFGQYLFGNEGFNRLDGGGGADTMAGYGGGDWYYVDNAADVVVEAAGQGWDRVYASASYTLTAGAEIEEIHAADAAATDTIHLTGNAFGQYLFGNEGFNRLDGGGGADTMAGYGGGDWYYVDDAADVVVEAAGQGWDRVYASASYVLNAGAEIEEMHTSDALGTQAINLTGNAFGQYLFGNEGFNRLDGAGGADIMAGYGGGDWYYVDNAADVVTEAVGQGWDRVYAQTSYFLTAGAEIEEMHTSNASGTQTLHLTGNAFSQYLFGNEGFNRLDGGGGADTLTGYGGGDWYYVDNAGDVVVEAAGQGWDRVYASTSFVLTAGAEIEEFHTADPLGTAAIDLTGNSFGQYLFGNAGSNRLDGGLGADTLTGGGGADQFAFTTAIGGGNVDSIADFQPGIDRILLAGGASQPFAALATGNLAAGAFAIGSVAADANDYLIYNQATGALLYDADGNGAGAAVQFATIQAGLNLTAADFIVTGAANAAPVISSGGTASVAENSSTSTIVYQTTAADTDGDRISYSLTGADAAAFTIDANGAVRLVSPADFETRSSYNFTVNALDSAGATGSRAVTLTVTDVADTGPATPIINETTALNNTVPDAQAIDRAVLQPSSNPLLFDASLPSATIKGSISAAADVDVYSITLVQGEKLILDIDNTTGDLDTVVRIYDGSGKLLGFVDDARIDPGSPADHNDGTGYDSFFAFRAPTSGTFYFSVESWGEGVDNGPGSGTTTGSYDLNVSIGPVASAAQILEEDIEALIDSQGWPDPNANLPGTNLTYSFPNSPSDYPAGTSEVTMNFEQFNSAQQNAVGIMLQQIASFANLTFDRLLDPQDSSATIRYAMSDEPDVAYAYLPGGTLGGTAWFRNSPIDGRSTPSFDNPVPGGYAWMSIVHETGHTLGLKHGHEAPAVSFDRDTVEYTVMTYRSHVGQTPDGYTNEQFGFPSTPMALDIAALQRLYGANFTFNSGDSVYTWSPTTGQMSINGVGGLTPGGNRVFLTIWDGGGNDTYDMSNYTTGVRIDLRPGEYSLTSQVQLANLGEGFFARGNVLNAFLYNDDPRSLIENAIGGSGNDTLIANQTLNHLTGGGGTDTFRWSNTTDTGVGSQADVVEDFVRGTDKLDLSQIDAISGTSDNDSFTFIGASAFHNVAGELRFQVEGDSVRIQGDLDGNGVADMEIVLNHVTSLDSTNFFF